MFSVRSLNMKIHLTFFCVLLGLIAGCKTSEPQKTVSAKNESPWLGIHLFVQSNDAVDSLAENLPRLAAIGVNAVIVEVNYNYDFKSHPELRGKNPITRKHARKLAAAARKNKIQIIPEVDCLGHQSWRKSAASLLGQHPEFMEPIGDNTDKDGAHLYSWCPQNPDVYKVVFDLIDEISDGFSTDTFHVGMDEVFCIASDKCPRCQGGDPAKLFAKAVNDLHKHIVGKRKMKMLMWGDRLLDGPAMKYGKWEGSANGTHPAIDLIPKDIVICDWHYEKRESYPSVPLFLEKGFHVWPSGWQPLESTKAFSNYSRELRKTNPNIVGYLCTAWSRAKPNTAADWPPIAEIVKDWKN